MKKKADVALGHKCGYVSPIPYIELKEDINEDLFKRLYRGCFK